MVYTTNVTAVRPVAVAVQLLNLVQLFVTPHCSTPDFLVLHCFLELAQTPVESVISSNHLILCLLLLLLPSVFPSVRIFSNESTLHIRWQSSGASASASVLPMDIQGWFLLRLTDLLLGLTDLLAIPGTLKSCCC